MSSGGGIINALGRAFQSVLLTTPNAKLEDRELERETEKETETQSTSGPESDSE